MSGLELTHDTVDVGPVDARVQRAAAVHVADRVASEHPHPLDEQMPKLAGRLTGRNPEARQQLLDLLDALGVTPAARRRAT